MRGCTLAMRSLASARVAPSPSSTVDADSFECAEPPACPVCLEAYRPRRLLRVTLPCEHVLCLPCLTRLRAATCPLCRAPFDMPPAVHVVLHATVAPPTPAPTPAPTASDVAPPRVPLRRPVSLHEVFEEFDRWR